MKAAGRRSGTSNAFSKFSPLDPISSPSPEPTRSAAQAQAERQIKALQQENKCLREELSEIRSAYQQLVQESTHEKFDERRVNMLKSQLIQLERQILILNNALGARSEVLLEVENGLLTIAECCRAYTDKPTHIGTVQMTKEDCQNILKSAESCRIKLYKTLENTTSEKLTRPLLMMNSFLKANSSSPITIMDVCSGKVEHINLKHVSKLESKLVGLYKHLLGLNQTLYTVTCPGPGQPANRTLPQAVYAKLGAQMAKACNLLHQVNCDLLDLSVLVPAAPWPPLQKPVLQELTTDHIMSSLPNFPKAKVHEARHMIDGIVKAFNYTKYTAVIQEKLSKQELSFHQAIYQLQLEYVISLFEAIREGYSNFESNTNEMICKPMAAILKNYKHLKKTASEDGLKRFLVTFKERAVELEDIIAKMKANQTDVDRGFSDFGEQFFQSLEKIDQTHQQKRNQYIEQLDIAKGQKKAYIEELKQIFPMKSNMVPDYKEEYAHIVQEVEPCGGGKVMGQNQKPTSLNSCMGEGVEEESCTCGVEHNKTSKKDHGLSMTSDHLDVTSIPGKQIQNQEDVIGVFRSEVETLGSTLPPVVDQSNHFSQTQDSNIHTGREQSENRLVYGVHVTKQHFHVQQDSIDDTPKELYSPEMHASPNASLDSIGLDMIIAAANHRPPSGSRGSGSGHKRSSARQRRQPGGSRVAIPKSKLILKTRNHSHSLDHLDENFMESGDADEKASLLFQSMLRSGSLDGLDRDMTAAQSKLHTEQWKT